jgi:hypothetical protein
MVEVLAAVGLVTILAILACLGYGIYCRATAQRQALADAYSRKINDLESKLYKEATDKLVSNLADKV